MGPSTSSSEGELDDVTLKPDPLKILLSKCHIIYILRLQRVMEVSELTDVSYQKNSTLTLPLPVCPTESPHQRSVQEPCAGDHDAGSCSL